MKYVESLNQALHRLFKKDPRVLLIGEDVLDPYGGAFKVSKGLSSQFPERVFTAPISEASIVGMGTGLALSEMRPIVEIMFGDFLLLAADQIVNSATKFQLMFDNKVSVPLVIRVPMGGRRGYGPTHSQTLEAFFINTPNLEIVAPSHLHDVGLMLEKAVLESNGVKLFVENKLLYSQDLIDISSEHPIFCFKSLECYSGDPFPTIQASIRDEDAADVILITYGGMSPFALEAAEKSFLEEEISTTCLLVSRVKPLPISAIKQACASSKKILIVEEGVKYGGWGSELSVQLHEANKTGLPIKIQRVGMREYVIPSAKALEDQILPQTYDIYQSIKELFDER